MSAAGSSSGTVLALSGGVGGAKLALGLSRVLAPGDLCVVVNTGDDFQHLGLAISPDIDTLLYTLAGLADPDKGGGRQGETWQFMAALKQLGGEDWFALGDADLAMHVERTRRLAAGQTLRQITADFAKAMGISATVLPMSDDPVRTRVHSDEGWLAFQHYFVRRRCEPRVLELAFEGAAQAQAAPELLAMAHEPAPRAVVICPSNPFLSIDPLLALPGVREALANCPAPVLAVSPIVAGRAVKGPTAKMMTELGLQVSHASVARHYAGLIDALIVDADEPGVADCGVPCIVAPTLMTSLQDREQLARRVLAEAERIGVHARQRKRP